MSGLDFGGMGAVVDGRILTDWADRLDFLTPAQPSIQPYTPEELKSALARARACPIISVKECLDKQRLGALELVKAVLGEFPEAWGDYRVLEFHVRRIELARSRQPWGIKAAREGWSPDTITRRFREIKEACPELNRESPRTRVKRESLQEGFRQYYGSRDAGTRPLSAFMEG